MADHADATRKTAAAAKPASGSAAARAGVAQTLNARPALVEQRAAVERLSVARTARPSPRPMANPVIQRLVAPGLPALTKVRVIRATSREFHNAVATIEGPGERPNEYPVKIEASDGLPHWSRRGGPFGEARAAARSAHCRSWGIARRFPYPPGPAGSRYRAAFLPGALLGAHMLKMRDELYEFRTFIPKPARPPRAPAHDEASMSAQQLYGLMVDRNDALMARPEQGGAEAMHGDRKKVWIKTLADLELLAHLGARAALAG